MFPNNSLNRISAERPATDGCEQGIAGLSPALRKPCLQCKPTVCPKRRCAFFSTLAHASEVRSGAKLDIANAKADHLRYTQAGLEHCEKQNAVAPPKPGRLVRCLQQGLHLVTGQEVHDAFFVPLGRHRQHLLAMVQELGLTARDVFEERANGREASVPASRAVTSFLLAEGQEPTDDVGVNVSHM
jgi:hypothetical protein